MTRGRVRFTFMVVFTVVSAASALLGGGLLATAAPPSTEPGPTTTTTTTTPTSSTTTTTTTTTPPTAPASPTTIYIPDPTAEVRLGCGSSASTRTVLSFTTNAPADQPTALLIAAGPEGGPYTTVQYAVVGDEVTTGPGLYWFWHVPGFFEGPWLVSSVVDTCTAAGSGPGRTQNPLPATGGDIDAELVSLAAALVAAGLLVRRLSTRRRALD